MVEVQLLGRQPHTWEGKVMGQGESAAGEVRGRQQLWGCSPPWLAFLLLLKLVPSTREHLLAWIVWLKAEASTQTQLQPLKNLRAPCLGTAAPLSYKIWRLAKQNTGSNITGTQQPVPPQHLTPQS